MYLNILKINPAKIIEEQRLLVRIFKALVGEGNDVCIAQSSQYTLPRNMTFIHPSNYKFVILRRTLL